MDQTRSLRLDGRGLAVVRRPRLQVVETYYGTRRLHSLGFAYRSLRCRTFGAKQADGRL